jgi:predicted nucleic acid-binding protein
VKKRYLIDANIIFSMLISGKSMYFDILEKNEFYVPDFALFELQKYQIMLLEKSKLSHEKLKPYTLSLFGYLTVVPNLLISTRSYLQAFQLCKDIDEDDTSYLAFAQELELTLLSKDDILIDGLRGKGYANVISLQEFLDEYL